MSEAATKEYYDEKLEELWEILCKITNIGNQLGFTELTVPELQRLFGQASGILDQLDLAAMDLENAPGSAGEGA